MEDQLLNGDSTALITASDCRSIAMWDEGKKKEFIRTFEERVEVASYILNQTAHCITQKATSRQFLSYKHQSRIKPVNALKLTAQQVHNGPYYNYLGGRPQQELDKIAEERAEDIIKKLPALKDAVKIIDQKTFDLIEEHKALKETCEKKNERLQELSVEIRLSDMEQDMTIGEFRNFVKETHKKKEILKTELYVMGQNLQSMETTIAKNLYAGIPGISDAIIAVINEHYERIIALENMSRRVSERVAFGDSDEALSLLEFFEKDEAVVSDNIQAEFDTALEKLHLSKQAVKQLKAAKKKKA